MSRTYKDVSVKYAPQNERTPKQRKTNVVDTKHAIEFELSAYNLKLATTSLNQLIEEFDDEIL